ncbi:MAG: phytanoyl-CoA dioxygenase family protein [Planctomycetota bacterium]
MPTDPSFEELSFAITPGLSPESEQARLRGLYSAPPDSLRTVVHTLDHQLVQGLETCANARESLDAIANGSWSLGFAQWYCKPPASPLARIPWHQDRAFWPPQRAHTLTTWIALDDVNEANGCVVVRPRSHGEGKVREHVPAPGTSVPSCSVEGTHDSMAMELSAGSGFVYHERLIHRSGGNATNAPRRALVLGWAPT